MSDAPREGEGTPPALVAEGQALPPTPWGRWTSRGVWLAPLAFFVTAPTTLEHKLAALLLGGLVGLILFAISHALRLEQREREAGRARRLGRFDLAADLLQGVVDEDLPADPVRRAQVLLEIAQCRLQAHPLDPRTGAALEAARAAAAQAVGVEGRLWAEVQVAAANYHVVRMQAWVSQGSEAPLFSASAREGLETWTGRILGHDPDEGSEHVSALLGLGAAFGEVARAEDALVQALPVLEKAGDEGRPTKIAAWSLLSVLQVETGRHQAAVKSAEQALVELERAGPAAADRRDMALMALVRAYDETGRAAEAEIYRARLEGRPPAALLAGAGATAPSAGPEEDERDPFEGISPVVH